jgi:tRNA threonylcarbamoyladenosine biosynthesis protein TsaE
MNPTPQSSADSISIESTSPEHTERIGRALMELLPDGALVALYGDLGAGKTCFVRGMAQATGAAHLVTSPTFTIVHEYPGTRPIIHLDLYRITDPRQVLDLGYEELFTPMHGVCVVEWPERADVLLPGRRMNVQLSHALDTQRHIELTNLALLGPDWRHRL